jgi:hypothetical protein
VNSAIEILEKSRDELANMDFQGALIQHSLLSSSWGRPTANVQSYTLAEEKGIELEKQHLLSKEKIANLKEKIKHLSNRKIKAPELKKLLKEFERMVGR